MQRYRAMVCSIALAVGVAGCGGGAPSEQVSSTEANSDQAESPLAEDHSGPAHAVYEFLEAVRTGSDQQAGSMFTSLARQKLDEMQLEVAPQGSDTARFDVETDSVEYISEGQGARVKSVWTDLGADGQPESQEITWMLRQEPEGWRIAGMGTKVFDDAPPLYLDFEDVEDILYKQQKLQEEFERRARAQELQATAPPNPEAPAQE